MGAIVSVALRHPALLIATAWSRLLPRDPAVKRLVACTKYGGLPRVPFCEVIPGLQDAEIRVERAFDRAVGTSLDFQGIAFLNAIVQSSNAKSILEIGTYDGNTALNLAANSAPDCLVTTVDLPPDWQGHLELEVPKALVNVTDRTRVASQYRGTHYESKIRQVFADSAKLDWASMAVPFDLVFIDGCHFYDYVKSDTENALRYLRSGGILVWHDYGSIADVSRVVDETANKISVKVIQGTRLAVGHMPLTCPIFHSSENVVAMPIARALDRLETAPSRFSQLPVTTPQLL